MSYYRVGSAGNESCTANSCFTVVLEFLELLELL